MPLDWKIFTQRPYIKSLPLEEQIRLFNIANEKSIRLREQRFIDFANSNPISQGASGDGDTGATPFNRFSLALDGTDDIASGSLSDGTIHGSRTLSFWIKLANNNTNMMIAQFNGSTTTNYFSVRRSSGGSILIGSKGASANGKTTGALDLSNWTHVLATKTGGAGTAVQTIFINGTETVAGNATVNRGTFNKTIIGKIGTIGYYGGDMEGEIDEISIFEGHLTSSANVSTIYNGGVPGDLTSLDPLLWYRCGDIVNGSGTNIPSQGSNTEGDLVLLNDASFSTNVPE